MQKYVLIKLIDSTTIVAKNQKINGDVITVTDPMLFNMKLSPEGHPVMSLVKYNPFSKSRNINLYSTHVICWYEPDEDLSEYYEKCLQYLKKVNSEIEKEKEQPSIKQVKTLLH